MFTLYIKQKTYNSIGLAKPRFAKQDVTYKPKERTQQE